MYADTRGWVRIVQQRPEAAPEDAVQLPVHAERPPRVGRGDPRGPRHPQPAGLRRPSTPASCRPGPSVETDEEILDWVAAGRRDRAAPVVHGQDGRRRACRWSTRRRCASTASTGCASSTRRVFPYVTNGNIYAPVMMVAEKAADLILGNTPLPAEEVPFYRHRDDTPLYPPGDSRNAMTARRAAASTMSEIRHDATARHAAAPTAARSPSLWKVFGPKGATRSSAPPDADLPRTELLEKTGCVAAVKDVSFDVAPGEVFVVMGLSGSGKSTLVRCLTRLIEPTAGSVEHRRPRHRRDVAESSCATCAATHVSMVFQHFGLLPHRQVIDNVAFGLEIRGEEQGRAAQRAPQEVVELVGLRATRTPTPTSSPAACSSASVWPARWPADPTCCCSTSRSPRSTRSSAATCRTRSSGCRRTSARRWSSSPTTSPRRSSWATGS